MKLVAEDLPDVSSDNFCRRKSDSSYCNGGISQFELKTTHIVVDSKKLAEEVQLPTKIEGSPTLSLRFERGQTPKYTRRSGMPSY